MKKITLMLIAATAMATSMIHAQTTSPSPYCAAGYDDGSIKLPRYISNVSFGGLSNNTGTTQYPGKHYVFYNNLAAASFTKGTSYPLSIGYSNTSYHYILVYIDYNQDNDFADAGERVFLDSNSGPYKNPRISNVIIPTTAKSGKTRMRVMLFEDDIYTMVTRGKGTPCTADTLDWGETEDYMVNISGGVGINDILKNSGGAIYPNPAVGNIQLNDALIGLEMMMMDLQGRIVLSDKEAKRSYNVSALKAGTYIIRFIGKDEVYTQKVSIEK